MLRHVRRMKLHYGEGFGEILEGFRQLVAYGNEHYDTNSIYFGMQAGDNREVVWMTDFEDYASLAAWWEQMMSDQAYWDLVGELVGPYTGLIEEDTSEVLRTL